MPTLYVITDDNGSRESCSVFYAGYILVDGHTKKKITPIIDAIIKADPEIDMFKLVAQLNKQGITASMPDDIEVIFTD
jgi:hypothetical protein